MRTRAQIATVMFVAAACSAPGDTGISMPGPTPPPAPLTGATPFLVSDPGPTVPATLLGSNAASLVDKVAYVSLSPGKVPGGLQATIRVDRTGQVVTRALVEGGLDPVPVPAAVGDTITLTLTRTAAAPLLLRFTVPATKAPVIVRTVPSQNKRDVPLNARMVVVFSEPIDPASVTAQSVILRTGTAIVPGTLAFTTPDYTTAEFAPIENLHGSTDYELVITQNVTDRDGTALDAPERVPFTTEAASGAGAAARINKLAGDAQQGNDGELLTELVRVSVTDAFGNAIAGRAVVFVVTAGGGSVTVSDATTAADGSASTAWRLGVGTSSNTLEVRTLDVPPVTFTATSRLLAGTFALTGSMLTARYYHTATLLTDGRVLVTGGESSTSGGGELASAELYDPATGTFSPTANTMTVSRAFHSATLLADGRVLIAGGSNSGRVSSGADLFDPATNTFVPAGNLLDAQDSQDGTLLPSGEVLFTGGRTIIGGASRDARAELYNPVTRLFRYTGPYADVIPVNAYNGLTGIRATLLSNGTVLIASLPRAEVYDPPTGTFTATGSMLTLAGLSYISGRTATLLTNGNVLLTGGSQEDVGTFSKAELYDPATGTFRYTMNMSLPRDSHSATRLASGKVLIAGGESFGNCDASGCDIGSVAAAEVYDVNGIAWTAVGAMKVPREVQRATLLKDGRVLITGGLTFRGGLNRTVSYTTLNSAELYTERP